MKAFGKGTEMKLAKTRPQFLGIEWEVTDGEGAGTVRLAARLCRRHREEIAQRHPGARGSGQMGESCDLCEGREPQKRSG